MRILFIMTRKMYPVEDGGQKGIHAHFSFIDAEDDFAAGIMSNVNDDCHDWKKFFPKLNDMMIMKRCHPQVKKNPIAAIGGWILSGKPRRAQVLVSKQYAQEVMKYILENDIETVLLEGPYGAEYLDFSVLKQHHIRVVLVDHNVEYIFQKESLRRFGIFALPEVQRTKEYEAKILPQADCVITVSPKDADILREQFGLKNVRFMPIPMAKNEKTWHESDTDYILFNGSLGMYTNRYSMQWFVKEVFSEFHKACPNIKLMVTGSVNDKIRSMFSAEGIEFTGFLSDEELERRLTSCLFVVSPIIIGSGTKLKLLEGLSYGIPIIATGHCFDGIPYDMDKKTPYIVAHDAKDYVEQMKLLAASAERRIALGAEAKRFFDEVYASDANREQWRKILKRN